MDQSSEITQFFNAKAFENSYLLSFEGIEGSGKSTQIKKLTENLKNSHYNVSYFREPGGTEFGEKLRATILESKTPIDPLAEANLFAASRAQLLKEKILPLLEQKNQIVILDRFIDSSIAYQGFARGLGIETILDLHKRFPLNTTPHCTIYLKIDIKTSMDRQDQRGETKDYFEKENHSFYTKLIEGYDQASKIFNDRISIVDATNNIDRIHKDIINTLKVKTDINI